MDNRYYGENDFDDDEIQEESPNYSQVSLESSDNQMDMQDDTSYDQLYNMQEGNSNETEENPFNRRQNNQFLNNRNHSNGNYPNRMNNNHRSNNAGNPENHQRPNVGVQPTKNNNSNSKSSSTNSKDVGSRNVKNSVANRSRNIMKNRKNKKKNGEKGSGLKNLLKSKNDSSSENESSSDNETKNDAFSKFAARIKRKIITYAIIVGLIVLLIMALFMAIFGVDMSFTIPAGSQSTYDTSDFVSSYEEGTDEYKKEVAYYKKLREASENYAKEHDENLKTNYIHSVLICRYYLSSGSEDEEEKDSPIDYDKMSEMIDTIVELMKSKDSSKTIDYEKNGDFYNNLKESLDFKKYYKDVLDETEINELLDMIFDMAEGLEEMEYEDDTVLTDETGVGVQQTSSDGKTTVKKLSMNEYLSGSIYANNSISNPEKVKAYTIAYSTNLVAKNKKLTVNSSEASTDTMYCSVKDGCSYDSNGNLVDGAGERSNKNTIYYNGSYYYKQPLSNSEIENLNKNINTVYGNVLVNSDGTYPEVDVNTINGLGDGDYKDILKNGYGDYKLKNIGEDSYILDGSYGTKKVLTDVIFYDQNDYRNYQFCGIKTQSIKSSGCGTTAMAIVTSTYENNKKYDPVMMMKTAHSGGYCGKGISGTSPSFFKKEASTMKYKYLRASKRSKSDLNLVLKHLSQGHLVITHMKSGHFTGGGHYMVLGGVDPDTKKVYVYDPNNASNSKNRKTGNGWFSFNDIIVKESFNYFYIIWKG